MDIPVPKTTAQAVKELRKELGETQQQFAVRLGLAISSVVRYERGSRPEPAVFVKLLNLSEEANRGDLAIKFREHVLEHFGTFALHAVTELREELARTEAALCAIPETPERAVALQSLKRVVDLAQGIDPFFQNEGAK